MLLEKKADAFRGHAQFLRLQVGGELFKTQLQMLDIFDQDQNPSLRA